MPTLAGLIRSQERFETDRNIFDSRSIDYLIARSVMEWDEFIDEIIKGDLEHALTEILDYFNLLSSLILHIITEIGVAPEQVDTIMDRINYLRDQKYRIELFREHPPEEAIKIARQEWTTANPKSLTRGE